MKQDMETNPSLKNYGLSSINIWLIKYKRCILKSIRFVLAKSDLNSASKPTTKSVDTEKKAAKPSVKPAVESTSVKRKAEVMPESKLGKWETVKEVKK